MTLVCLPRLVLRLQVLLCLAPPRLASSCRVLSCCVLSLFVAWSCPVLPCLASLCPGFFLPGLVWSYFLKSANKKLSVTTAFFHKAVKAYFC